MAPQSEPDPIILASALVQAAKELGENVLDCGIGVCSNEKDQPIVPEAIAELMKDATGKIMSATYLPGTGHPPFLAAARTLLFEKFANRAGSVQANGGTHALRIISDFLKEMKKIDDRFTGFQVYLPNPSWGNHILIFGDHQQHGCPYLSEDGTKVDIVKFTQAIQNLISPCGIILHPSCPNPASYPLSETQWDMILEEILRRQKANNIVIPIFDSAYQGFGKGLAEDAYPIRKAAEMEIEFFVAESYSKKFGLYRHRVGAAHFFSPEEGSRENTIKLIGSRLIRPTVSSLHIYGVDLAERILNSKDSMAKIEEYLNGKRKHFAKIRGCLAESLNMPRITSGEGMFVLIPGVSKEQQEQLWAQFKIMTVYNPWISPSGEKKDAIRVCLDPLNDNNINQFIAAVNQVRELP